MKKRLFIVIALLVLSLFATNTLWLPRIPVDINLNLSSNNEANVIVSLGSSKYDEKYLNLNTNNTVFFQVKKKGSFKVLKISLDLKSIDNPIYLSNVSLLHKTIKLTDLSKFEAEGANLSIKNDILHITPISKNVIISYPIKATPFSDFNLAIFSLITFLLGGTFIILLFPEVRNYIVNFRIIESKNNLFIVLSTTITIFIFSLFLLSFLGFIFHIPINICYIPISMLVTLIFVYNYSKKLNFSHKQFYILSGLLALTFIVSSIFSLYFYDASFDGRAYHQGSIILFINGWNPIFEKGLNDIIPYSVWSECYTKLAEILSSNFVLLSKNIEFGKIINFLFAFNLFYLALYTLNSFKNIKDYQKVLIALLVVLNPVCICQVKTFYVDLFVYYIFATFIFLFIAKEFQSIDNKLFLILMIANTTMLCNVKLGGILYTILFILAYFIYSCLKKSRIDVINTFIITSATVILVLLSGINPYFTNIKQGNHPFYPVMGQNKIDVMTTNSPKDFENKNLLYKLFYSTFSKTENILHSSDKKVTLKIPFDIFSQDSFKGPDMRIAGFGYLWSGILLLSLVLLFSTKNNKDENKNIYYFVFSVLWASILLNPEAWWARYAPQFWLIPIFIILWRLNNSDLKNAFKNFSYVLLVLMCVNVLMIDFKNIETSTSYRAEIVDFYKLTKNKKLQIYSEKSVSSVEMTDYPFYRKIEIENGTKCINVDEKYYLSHLYEFQNTPRYLSDTIKWRIKDE